MPDFEEAFRQGLGRIDTLPSPLPPLDGAELAARAAATPAPSRSRPGLARVLIAAAAVLLVIGTPVAIWLAWGSPQRPIPAEPAPAPAPSVTPVVIPPLTRTPSAHQVLVDDPVLINHQVPGDGREPGGFFVAGDTIVVDVPGGDRLAVYHGGTVVDSIAVPGGLGQFVVWNDTYYRIGKTLQAYVREGDALVETDVAGDAGRIGDLSRLIVEGPNLVAQTWQGQRYLVAGPGPLRGAPALDIVDDGFTILDGALDVHLQVSAEPSGVHLLGRDADHVWYAAFDDRGGFVYEFATDGRLTAAYTLDPRVTSERVQVANGRVYTLVIVEDSAEPGKGTGQIWELEPNPADGEQVPTDPSGGTGGETGR